MAMYSIVDIKVRMFKVEELLQIQGFPKNYVLLGNQEDKQKFIGNAVEVNMARAPSVNLSHQQYSNGNTRKQMDLSASTASHKRSEVF